MQVDHPADRLLIVARAEDVLGGALADLRQLALLLLDLHFDLINLVVASLVFEFEDFSELIANALP